MHSQTAKMSKSRLMCGRECTGRQTDSKLGGFLMRNIIVSVVGGMVILAVGVALAWWGMSYVSGDVARMWALLATVALPLVAWAGWYFGHTEARGVLHGLDKGVDKMFGGLSKAAGLGVTTSRQMPQVTQAPPVAVLPDVEIVQRYVSNGGEIIDL